MKSMKSMISYPLPYARPRFAIVKVQLGKSVEGDGGSSTSSTSSIGGRACCPSGAAPVPPAVRAVGPRGGRQRSINPLGDFRTERINRLAGDLQTLCTGGAA